MRACRQAPCNGATREAAQELVCSVLCSMYTAVINVAKLQWLSGMYTKQQAVTLFSVSAIKSSDMAEGGER